MFTLFQRAAPHVPTYTYTCTACNDVIEKRQSFSDPPLTTCDQCGGSLRKVFHPVGIVFKGSGWYITDSRSSTSSSNGPAAPAKATEPAATESAGSAGESSTRSTTDTGAGASSSSTTASQG